MPSLYQEERSILVSKDEALRPRGIYPADLVK